MLIDGEVSDIKVINNFPRAFKEECTPYNQRDFNEKTKRMCKYLSKFETPKIFKIIILGDVSVGKTCVVSRFCHQTFNSKYKATIGVDFEVELFTISGVSFTLQIWDTAGQERFKCIAQSYYRGAHAIMVFFDMSSVLSLSHCEVWLREALNAGNSAESFIFLVGNKKDLLSSAAYTNMEELGTQTAQKLGAEYWSVSAKVGENIKEMFYRMAALIFDASIEKEMINNANGLKIGTNLVSFKKSPLKKRKKSKCNCNNQVFT